MMGGSGISWTICKLFTPHSRQYLTTQFLQARCKEGKDTFLVSLIAFKTNLIRYSTVVYMLHLFGNLTSLV